jgi:hypothetical protein
MVLQNNATNQKKFHPPFRGGLREKNSRARRPAERLFIREIREAAVLLL